MKLSERIRRWWSPAEWRDEHPGEAGEGGDEHPLGADERLEDRLRDEHPWEVGEDMLRPLVPRGDDSRRR